MHNSHANPWYIYKLHLCRMRMNVYLATIAFACSNPVSALKIDVRNEAIEGGAPALGPIFDYGDSMAQEDGASISDADMLLAQDDFAFTIPEQNDFAETHDSSEQEETEAGVHEELA